jgi:hypothetical protein
MMMSNVSSMPRRKIGLELPLVEADEIVAQLLAVART